MCLTTVLRGKEKKVALAKLKDTVVVWKVLLKPGKDYYGSRVDCYQTDQQKFPVFAGVIKFKQIVIAIYSSSYRGGGHFWLTKKGAKNWIGWNSREKLIRCTIKKSDINAIGYQHNFPVVVVKKATFPKYVGKKK